MHFTIVAESDEGVLCLRGDLGLLQAGQFKRQLTEALDAHGRLRIDTEAVTDIDLACLQLFCAAHRSAVSRGKELTLGPRPPEAVKARISQAGLIHCRGCAHSAERPCLWIGEDG